MARRGHYHPLTPEQRRWVRDNAGALTIADMAETLGCTVEQIRRVRRDDHEAGGNLSLRCRQAHTCPRCGRRVESVTKQGLCRVCDREQRLATLTAEVADLMAQLPVEELRKMESRANTGNRTKVPMPQRPDVRGLSHERARRALRAYEKAVDDRKVAELTKAINAQSRRRDRVKMRLLEIQGGCG